MSLVDPFIPQTSPHKPVHTIANGSDQTTAAKQAPPKLQKKLFKPPPKPRIGRVKLALQTIVILLLAIALGFSLNILAVGEIAIAVYAVAAFWLRISSRISFCLALLSFSMIILLEIVQPASDAASPFAVYAFFLLVVSTLSLGMEARQEARWEKLRRSRVR